MRVAAENRDALARIADELGGISLDEALHTILFEHQCHAALARLTPEEHASYLAEAQQLAEVDIAVHD